MKNILNKKYALLALFVFGFFALNLDVASAHGLNNITTVMTFGNTPAVQIQISSLLQVQGNAGVRPSSIPTITITPGSITATTTSAKATSSSITTVNIPLEFSKDLHFGMNDGEVKLLQKYLNTHDFVLRNKGFGSKDNETEFFGPYTRAALIRFQNVNHITPALGFFGPKTRALINFK